MADPFRRLVPANRVAVRDSDAEPSSDLPKGDREIRLELRPRPAGALPEAANSAFGANVVSSDADHIVVEAKVPGDAASADFFLAGEEGYLFGTPTREDSGAGLRFSVPVLERPIEAPGGPGLNFTLTTASGAVAGTLPYPE